MAVDTTVNNFVHIADFRMDYIEGVEDYIEDMTYLLSIYKK